MTMKIDGVPETIERSKVLALVDAMGLDVRHIVSLSVGCTAMTAVVYALRDGRRYLDNDHVVTHAIAIPIVDDSPTQHHAP